MEGNARKYLKKGILQKGNGETEYSLENDFKLFKNACSIPIPNLPFYTPFGIMGICQKGTVAIKMHQREHRFAKGELMVILPRQTVSLKEKSDDFVMDYFTLSQELIDDTLSGISRLSPLFFIHIRKKLFYKLTKDEIYRYSEYYNLIDNRTMTADCIFQREYILSVLRLFYLDLYNSFKNSILSIHSTPDSRKEKLAYRFFLLILKHYKENREITYYADQLSITSKYLSKVIKEVSARSAKDWVVEYTLLEIKSLLDNTALNIQEIALDTHFSNQASLGRFFKKHTGMSPSQYRSMDKR
ncbi:AraC family transcriptional regulator [Dysgonomonas sp. 521]|uniref:helix-turn-helix domain-containing protein n=1 Tax=Dysgonomonas sp. 521 TaxID=2302932 RepID=UPI0013D5B052|nr:helix-turn-helix domain-containing protein [Dysgonomonas sp. 521]NDV96070.1 AraC family transcriptional regulator [Dysgonomonas sp. 521]